MRELRLHKGLASAAALALAILLVAGCAGHKPREEEPPPVAPEIREMQERLAYSHFTDGSFLFSNGDYQGAAEAFERALRMDPESIEIRLSLAESYFRMRQFTRAVTVAGAIEPKTEQVYGLLGRAYGYMGQNDDARQAYLKLLELDSTNTQAYWFLKGLARNEGRLEDAAAHLTNLALYRPDPRVYNELGDVYRQMGRVEDAVAAFRQSIDIDSSTNNRHGLIGLAAGLEAQGRLAEAANYYVRVVEASPEDVATRQRLLHLYLRTDQTDLAIGEVEEILHYDPDSNMRIRLGFLLYDTEQYDRAESLFVSVAETDGEDAYIGLFYLGRIYDARGNPEVAKEYFRRGTELADSIPDAWIHWGNTLLDQDSLSEALAVAHKGMHAASEPEAFYYFMGLAFSQFNQYDSAAFYLDRAWQSDTVDSRVQFALAAALERSGRFDEAAGHFSSLIAREPTNSAALNYLGYMYADSGVYLQESLKMIERALEQDPDNGAYLDSFGWVLYRLGRLEEAEQQIRRALEILRSDATIFDHLGDILAAGGRVEEARENWRKALELDPNNSALREKLSE